MKIVQIDGSLLKFAFKSVRFDYEILHLAISQNSQALRLAQHGGLLNWELITAALTAKDNSWFGKRTQSIMTIALNWIKKNPSHAISILEKDPNSAPCAVRNFKNAHEILNMALSIQPCMISRVWRKKP